MATEFRTNIIVRYAETDQMGAVHHASYVIYFEAARVEHMKSIRAPYHELEKRGIFLPVVELSTRYYRSARFGDELVMRSRLFPVQGIRLRVEYELYRAEELLADGHTVHAFVDQSGKLKRPSAETIQLFA